MQPPNSAAVAGREQREGGGSRHYGRARGDLPCEAGDDRRRRVGQVNPCRRAEDSAATPPGNQERRHPQEDVPYTKQAHQEAGRRIAVRTHLQQPGREPRKKQARRSQPETANEDGPGCNRSVLCPAGQSSGSSS
jgi:hypothetical protein